VRSSPFPFPFPFQAAVLHPEQTSSQPVATSGEDSKNDGGPQITPRAAAITSSSQPNGAYSSASGSSAGISSSASSSAKPGSVPPAPIFSSEARSLSNSWP
jgi:hypothetical protein